MIRFEDLVEKVSRYHPNDSIELIQRGYVVSAKYHKGQVRMSGEPYLTHPLEVANILAEFKMDAVTVTAGLLHDVLEDTLMTPEELQKQFGNEVYLLVDGVTKIAQVQLTSRQQKQAETFRKMLLAMVRDIRVLFVKLADRLHNMRTLHYLPPERRERIAMETLDIYAPLANRLGMSKVRGELEDMAFSFLDPVAYQSTVAQIEARRAVNQDFISEAKNIIINALAEHNIPAWLESRTKRIYGIYTKMKRQKISIDEVFDFIAIRIITDSVKNCYSILGILHNIWKPVPGRIKDYIAIPRSNLYQSLHTSVVGRNGQPFEIQIRTQEMHRIAEEGVAAHWKYKEGKQGAVDGEDQFRWLRQLVDSQQEAKDPREFLSNLKIDLYSDEVYCFTPKGEVISLPRDATPVDFAYAIHTEVGNHCEKAKVNGRLVPLWHKIKNGEIVEVITSKGASPRREWLSFVKTARTRGRIRRYINQTEKENASDLGRKLMEKEAHKFGVSWKNVLDMPALSAALAKCGLRTPDEIYPAVGFGTLTPRQILGLIFPDQSPATEFPMKKFDDSADPKLYSQDSSIITVKGQDGLLVYRAKCCNPIRGDEIIGYITRGKGIFVHATSCPQLENLLGTDRITEVQWVDDPGEELFAVRLNIVTDDQQKIHTDILTAITNRGANIRESTFRSKTGSDARKIEVVLNVIDAVQLQDIIQELRSIPGVREVVRAHSMP